MILQTIQEERKTLVMRRNKIPVSVIVVTKNEEKRIKRCLEALSDFDEVVVVDSQSQDKTAEISRSMGAEVVDFCWNGEYPKKRQWCLDELPLAHDWVFFVDADEIVLPEVVDEIAALFNDDEPHQAGFFVRAKYIWFGKMLRFGLMNSKLILFERTRVEFGVVDDLGLIGMGEIEGHYQPNLNANYAADDIGMLRTYMLHDAGDDMCAWTERHLRYAQWEAGMIERRSWPDDPIFLRRFMKHIFRNMPFRSAAAFLHSYVLNFGFLDGKPGLDFARSRAQYYAMISAAASKTNKG